MRDDPKHSRQETGTDEHPKERLLLRGTGSLTDAELLAVLLSEGGEIPLGLVDLARDLLENAGGLLALATKDASTLRRETGSGDWDPLRAALELTRRIAREKLPRRKPLTTTGDVARYLRLHYGSSDQRILGAVYLDGRAHLIRDQELYRGTLHHLCVEPREVLKRALRCGAAGILLFQLRPGGDPEPSREDFRFRDRLAEAARVVGVELVDYLVIANDSSWVSLLKRRRWILPISSSGKGWSRIFSSLR